jgi:DNA-binding transcriptional regulator YhcF (GntR family)
MENVRHIDNLYGSTLINLVKGMKSNMANQKIDEFADTLLGLGYSKQELVEYINIFFKGEK